jgi:hypothetical protein
MNEQINQALLLLKKRAEMSEPSILVKTFVGTGMLQTMLQSQDHQIIFGRRGTGKTHAMHYVAETRRAAGDVCAYIDMRIIGSSIGLFADDSIPLPERATRLLRDTLATLHEKLLDAATEPANSLDLGRVGPSLDALIDAALQTEVVGSTVAEQQDGAGLRNEVELKTTFTASTKDVGLQLSTSDKLDHSVTRQQKVQQTGTARHRVRFGAISQALATICESIRPKRIWVLMDEWSAVPLGTR